MVWTCACSDGVAEGKYPNFGRVARSVSPLAMLSWLLLLGPASLALSLKQAQTQSKDRDTIQWDLWVQFVCFNGQGAPKLTTDRPLWDVHSWDINVRSHQGFIKFWPCGGFPWPWDGLWFVGSNYEHNLQLGTISIPYCFLLCKLDFQSCLLEPQGLASNFQRKLIGG